MAGEVVPFSGQLMTNRRAAKLVVTTEQCEDWRALDLEEAHELHQIQLQMVEEQRENDIKTHEMQLDLYRQREAELAPVWYEHPVFVAGTSVILTVALFSLAVKTVESLR